MWVLALAALLLTGCGKEQEFEPVTDVYAQQTAPQMRQIVLTLPEDAAMTVMDTDINGKMYFCDKYILMTYTAQAGDLQKTIKNATGFSMEDLQIMQTQQGDMTRYLCVWTAAGEGENQVGRACILDDGSYHYVLTAMAGESDAWELQQGQWQTVFRSFRALTADQIVNSGS